MPDFVKSCVKSRSRKTVLQYDFYSNKGAVRWFPLTEDFYHDEYFGC